MAATAKARIDILLVERGLAQSRERARALILAGRVLVNEQKIDKPAGGLLYFPMEKQKLKDLEVRYGPQEGRIIPGQRPRYLSRPRTSASILRSATERFSIQKPQSG